MFPDESAEIVGAGAPTQQQPQQPPQPHEGSVEQPAKLLRIAVMVREMLEEVRRAPIDEYAREHLSKIHTGVLEELKSGLSGPLREELDRITMPLDGENPPTESEIRIAQAQLLGWLEGLFQGIQAAIATQQMAAAAQLEEMRRRGLPPGAQPRGMPGSPSPAENGPPGERPGQYL
ncbi:MAG TPA: proteasome activator [Actinomycetota bacterium]|nr:proteasome activator [Actinomycetota bacterium]